MINLWIFIENLKSAIVDDEEGISAVEYALLGAFIIAGLALTMPSVMTAINGAFTSMKTGLAPAAG